MVSQGSYFIPQQTLVHWGGQPRFLMYSPANSGSSGLVSQGSYCIPQLILVHWSGQSGFLLYTQADSSSLGWSARVPIIYLSQLWFTRVVSKVSYCRPQPTLVRWGGQPRFLMYSPANSGLSGLVSQGYYCISQLTLVHWSGQSGFLLYTRAD